MISLCSPFFLCFHVISCLLFINRCFASFYSYAFLLLEKTFICSILVYTIAKFLKKIYFHQHPLQKPDMTRSTGTFELKTYRHISNYPFVQEFSALLTSITILNSLLTIVKGYINLALQNLSKYQIFTTYANSLDTTLDSWLSFFDQKLPFMSNFSFGKHYHDLQQYCYEVVASLNSRYLSLRKSLESVFESSLKKLEPILRLTNNYYESILNFILPMSPTSKTEAIVGKITESSEIDRMKNLSLETYKRLQLTASNVSKLPVHVSDTYKKELENEKSATKAVTSTTRKLSNDAYQTIKPTIEKVVSLTKSTTEEAKNPILDFSEEVIHNAATATGVEVH